MYAKFRGALAFGHERP